MPRYLLLLAVKCAEYFITGTKLPSFQFVFLLLCAFWTGLRAVFFSIYPFKQFNAILSSIIFWLPINFEFSTFSLLALFLAHLVHKHDWDQKGHWRASLLWASTNFVLVLLNVGWLCIVGSGQPSAQMVDVRVIMTGIVYFALSGLLGRYSLLLRRALKDSSLAVSVQLPGRLTHGQLESLLLVVLLVFASRAIR
eukprot:Colp12_sorted_trinity150504_noHs@2054